ncbi:MAG: hypothetical protein D3912_11885 [Candidatus Electrothrix sp. AX1]|nr:hypothetical protein [Candidatus Electrothrix sp. AX1]
MGDRYLNIVFPHPEWGGSYDGYSSDFRAAVADETQGDSWIFEVRTRTPDIRTAISWKEGLGNPFATLPYSRNQRCSNQCNRGESNAVRLVRSGQ